MYTKEIQFIKERYRYANKRQETQACEYQINKACERQISKVGNVSTSVKVSELQVRQMGTRQLSLVS